MMKKNKKELKKCLIINQPLPPPRRYYTKESWKQKYKKV